MLCVSSRRRADSLGSRVHFIVCPDASSLPVQRSQLYLHQQQRSVFGIQLAHDCARGSFLTCVLSLLMALYGEVPGHMSS